MALAKDRKGECNVRCSRFDLVPWEIKGEIRTESCRSHRLEAQNEREPGEEPGGYQ